MNSPCPIGTRGKRTLLLLSFLLALSAPAAYGLNQDLGPGGGNDITACGSTDECFHSGDWWYVHYDNYGSTTTCGLYGCQICVNNGFGKMVCAYHVPFGNGCNCQNKPRRPSTPAITECVLRGACVVTSNP